MTSGEESLRLWLRDSWSPMNVEPEAPGNRPWAVTPRGSSDSVGSRKGAPQASLRTTQERWQRRFPGLGGPALAPWLCFRGPRAAPSGTRVRHLQPPARSGPPQGRHPTPDQRPGAPSHQRPSRRVLGRWPRSLQDWLWRHRWLSVCEPDPLPASATLPAGLDLHPRSQDAALGGLAVCLCGSDTLGT